MKNDNRYRLRQIIRETINKNLQHILTEGAESRNISAAKHYLYDKRGCDEQEALKIIGAIKTDIPNVRLAKCKFLLGVTRMFINGELSDGNIILNLNRTLKLIASDAHVNEYSQDLNGMSCNELIQRFKGAVQQELQQAKDNLSKEQYSENSDYQIVKIDTPEEAAKYGKYTPWCVTHDERMYDTYTNDQIGRFYFCLKNGFESVPKQKGENCPLDEYGLSMIAVSVNIDGSCNTVTCRWNHDNGGNDHIMTDKEVSQLIGRNFYETFLPKTREELEATGKFINGWHRIENNNGYTNFINIDGEYLSEQWFDDASDFDDGIALVELKGLSNYIKTNGKIISDQWFYDVWHFREGFAMVTNEESRYNYIDTNGKLLSDKWFDEAESFSNNLGCVQNNGKYNYIKTDGTFLLNEWYDYIGYFFEGYAIVSSEDKGFNFINPQGEFLCNQWFDSESAFKNGFAKVVINHKFNFINDKGNLISDQWFDDVSYFDEAMLACVMLNNKRNFLKPNGELLSKVWFDAINPFEIDYKYNHENAFARVQIGRSYNVINLNGELLFPNNFNNTRDLYIALDDYKQEHQNESIIRTITNHIYDLLTEGRNADKAKTQTLQVIRNYFNNASWLDNEFEEPAANPNHLSVIDYIENKFKEWLFHANISDAVIRLEPIMMKVALNLGYEQDPSDVTKLNRLGMMVEYIKLNYKKEEFPIPLNKLTLENTTYDSLNEIFGKIVDDEISKDNAEANSSDDNSQMNPNYEIIEVKDYKTAHEIGNYSCSESKLCYTQGEHTWKQYLGRDNRVYVVLRKNYKDIPEEHGENTPYDEYGLSMIFLFINPDGNIAYSNTRWNHKTLGKGPSNVDQSFKKSDISKLLGVNFDETFKPIFFDYSNYEVESSINGWARCVCRSGNTEKYNLQDLNTGKFISKQWFDYIEFFTDSNYAQVYNNHEYNLIDTNGNLIFDEWFDSMHHKVGNGLIPVTRNDEYNFIDSNLEFVSDRWFDEAWDIKYNRIKVMRNYRINFLDENGDIVSNLWFDNAWDYTSDGIAKVKYHERFNFIDLNGNLTMKIWIEYIDRFSDEGIAYVKADDKCNYINRSGKILSDIWFDLGYLFKRGYAMVQLNDKWNLMDSNGKFVSKIWYDAIGTFSEGFAYVKDNNKFNYINTNGELLSKQWFDRVDYFEDGVGLVKLNKLRNAIDKQGNLVSDKWFESADDVLDYIDNLHYKKVRNESIVHHIANKVLNQINEGRNADKAKAQTYQVIRDFCNNSEYLDDVFDGEGENPEQLTTVEYLEKRLREWLFHSNISDAIIRLEPIIMNIALNLGFLGGHPDATRLNQLGSIVEYIKLNYKKDDFPIQLNKLTIENTTFDSLNKLFGKAVSDSQDLDNKDANSYSNKNSMNPNYEVIEVKDFKQAHEIGKYSCSKSTLCYTKDDTIWNSYTNKGRNSAYAILRKGYKDIPEEHGENTPYDEYGLSMIFVFIRPDGNIAYSNTRWNHETNGKGVPNVDQSFKKSDISKLLGVNFDSVFKPVDYTPGLDYRVIDDFYDGWALVRDSHEYVNYINKDDKLLSDKWFDIAYRFSEGFGRVYYDNKGWNYINQHGKIISDNWFKKVTNFRNGFASVGTMSKWNFINTNGDLISNKWFDYPSQFDEYGYAYVELPRSECNFISGDGKFISDKNFINMTKIDDGIYCGIFKNEDNGKIVSTRKGCVLPQFFDYVDYDFKNGCLAVDVVGKGWNFLNSDCEFISDTFFDKVESMYDYAIVTLNKKQNYLSGDGKLLSDIWFDKVSIFYNGVGFVTLNKKCNVLSSTKGILFSKWFDNMEDAMQAYETYSQNEQ